jgi:hypothetical protein
VNSDLFEVGADGVDLMDEIFDRQNTIFTQRSFDDVVRCQGNALLVNLSVAPLVDQFPNRLEIWFTVVRKRNKSVGKQAEGVPATNP